MLVSGSVDPEPNLHLPLLVGGKPKVSNISNHQIPSLKLTACPLKMDDWKMFFFGKAYFQGLCQLQGMYLENMKTRTTTMCTPLKKHAAGT